MRVVTLYDTCACTKCQHGQSVENVVSVNMNVGSHRHTLALPHWVSDCDLEIGAGWYLGSQAQESQVQGQQRSLPHFRAVN